MPDKTKHNDILIIGSGTAGLYATDRAASIGARVTLVTHGRLASGSNYWGQSGIAAVTKDDDSFDAHIANTLHARIQRGLEGGHSRRRILHAYGVQTGKALVEFLIDRVRAQRSITVI